MFLSMVVDSRLKGTALNLEAFDPSLFEACSVVPGRAWRREFEVKGVRGDIFRHLARHAERLSRKLVIIGGEGLGGGQDFAHTLGLRGLARALRHEGSPQPPKSCLYNMGVARGFYGFRGLPTVHPAPAVRHSLATGMASRASFALGSVVPGANVMVPAFSGAWGCPRFSSLSLPLPNWLTEPTMAYPPVWTCTCSTVTFCCPSPR